MVAPAVTGEQVQRVARALAFVECGCEKCRQAAIVLLFDLVGPYAPIGRLYEDCKKRLARAH